MSNSWCPSILANRGKAKMSCYTRMDGFRRLRKYWGGNYLPIKKKQSGSCCSRTWLILGATSIIAEKYAHEVAKNGHNLILAGRNLAQLEIIAADLSLRYHVNCQIIGVDFSHEINNLIKFLQASTMEIDLFIAHAQTTVNNELNYAKINDLILVNILSTVQIINAYLQKSQTKYHLFFLSSVAACRGRAKNSLYGASKKAIETYLAGLQQQAAANHANLLITIARLGFIDTKQTYGLSGIFYVATPTKCAAKCWQAMSANKRLLYYPAFWYLLCNIINVLPFFLYKRIKE